MNARILIVDDDDRVREVVGRMIARAGHVPILASSADEGLEVLRARPIDLVMIDVHMPGRDGLSMLSQMRIDGHDQPVVVISGEGTMDTAVRALQLGAIDFLEKPLTLDKLRSCLDRALKYLPVESDPAEPIHPPIDSGLIGTSPAMRQLRALIARTAPTDARVLLTGENGSGKELVARAIHAGSRRSNGPFVKMSCAAVVATLVDSELFGHERGAFTGAERERRGRFERADGGTLLLDEVAEMPLESQAKLLRVLQEGELERVGGDRTVPVDVRVIASTNRNLEAMVRDGTFREDLFYRLNVMRVALPPLRGRWEDIPLLAKHFVTHYAKRHELTAMQITPDALQALREHDYPGNVRELQNLVERMVIVARDDRIDEQLVRGTIPARIAPEPTAMYRAGETLRTLNDEALRRIITEAIEHHDGNMTRTARSLGIERSHLYKKCRALRLAA